MNPPLLRSSKTAIAAGIRHVILRRNQQPSLFYSSYKEQRFPANPTYKQSLIGSPSRVQKLIASQSDPLLAKEIFDYASRHPNFRHSYTAYLVLILKLGKSKHFSLIDAVVGDLRSKHYPVTPQLFSYLIRIYGDANMLDKVIRTLHTMMEFNFKPLPKHLNLILERLVSRRSYVKPALDLFREAKRQGVAPNTKSYNILMRAMCLNDELSIAYKLFDEMFKRDVVPDVESYRILMQALCRKSQVNGAVNLLEDMLNKGFVPDSLTYTTILNSLCRKTKLREAYKLLCRMKVKGCNPDIVHYNTVILGFCREGRAMDACKVLQDMEEDSNGCLPNVVSYRTLVAGLCDQGMIDEAKVYLSEMVSKGFSPHFSVADSVVKGLCGVGKIEEACGVVEELLKNGEVLHLDTWEVLVPRVCNGDDELERIEEGLNRVMKLEIKGGTRIVDAGAALEGYLIDLIQGRGNRG
ncbi:Pentatricopeptide repeat-containing protein At4g01400, mitochondrial [Linum perenne]